MATIAVINCQSGGYDNSIYLKISNGLIESKIKVTNQTERKMGKMNLFRSSQRIEEPLKIGGWNIQRLGQNKMSKKEVVKYLVKVSVFNIFVSNLKRIFCITLLTRKFSKILLLKLSYRNSKKSRNPL